MTPLEAAADLAANHGIPVFWCGSDKKPLTEHGFMDATTDLDVIERTWRPNALLAVPTGAASKLFVIDVDPNGADWYAQNAQRLGAGRVHRTKRGHHLLHRYRDGLRNTASKLAPGVDTRGEGGYVIWWPAHGHETIGGLEDVTDPPQWVIEALFRPSLEKSRNGTANDCAKYGVGDRHAALLKVASQLRRADLTGEGLEAALIAWNVEHCDPPQDVSDVRRIAQDFTQKPRVPPQEPEDEAPKFERHPIDWRALIGQTPPERDWAVSHWLGMGYVTLLAGQGGLGKTLIAQTFGTCLALGRGYVDYAPKPRRVLMLAGEDDADELWRRQLAICEWLGVGLDAIAENFICESYSNRDMTLADVVYGKLVTTPFMAELRQQIADYRAEYVFLDSAARVFGGNENDRHHVTQFITWLTAAAGSAGLCLLAHPSKAIGSEFSGSTAWEGSVRSRLYLGTELPDVQRDKDDPQPDENERYLARRKVNYTDRDWRKFTYQNGVLVPAMDEQQKPVSKPTGEFAQDIVIRAINTLATKFTLHGTASTASPYYLPKLARKNELLEGLSEKEFARHMREMMKTGKLVSQVVGKYSGNRTDRWGLVAV